MVSPNGRYVFYAEVNEEYDEQEAISSSKRRDTRYTVKTTKIIGRVAEIVSLRPKKDIEKVNHLLKKKTLGRNNRKELYKKLEEQINLQDISFCLRPIRSIPDVGSTLNLYDDPNKDEQHESSRIHITNSGDVIFIDRISKSAFFNDINLSDTFEGDMNSFKWSFVEKGLVAFNKKDIYYLTINEKKKTAEKMRKIKVNLNPSELEITNIHSCPNGRYITICLTNKYYESILLVWDLVVNREKHNYSITGEYSFITKPNSEFGVVLCSDYYINLDVGLINYYFDHDFSDYPWGADQQGCKMDKKELTVLYKGRLLMKEMY